MSDGNTSYGKNTWKIKTLNCTGKTVQTMQYHQ